MSSEFLEVYQENCEELLEESLPSIQINGLTYQNLLGICENYRIKAITHLLLNYDVQAFKRNLFKSGRAFLAGIELIPKETMATSKAAGLYDAIVCGDNDGAVKICKVLRKTWNKNIEYKEDFLFVMFIMSQFGFVDETFEFDDFHYQYIEALGGESEPALDLLKAIYVGDQQDFDVAIIEYLDEYKTRMRSLVEHESISPEIAATEGYICINAIILLKLAERKNFLLDSDYPLVPLVSRCL